MVPGFEPWDDCCQRFKGVGGLRVKLTPHHSFQPKTVINLDGFSLCPCALKLAGPRSTEEGEIHLVLGHPLVSKWAWTCLPCISLPFLLNQTRRQEWFLKMDSQNSSLEGNGLSPPVENQSVCLKTPSGCFLEFLLAVNFVSMWQSLSQENVDNYGWGQEESIICFPKRGWGKKGDKLHS